MMSFDVPLCVRRVDNYARPLKTLRGLTSYDFVIQQWVKVPKRFKTNLSPRTEQLKPN